MNLNTYIGLMGRRLKETSGRNGLWLEPCAHDEVGFEVSDAKYVLTLDADSLLLPAYSLRLVHFMEQPQNKRVAVAQTPYSAVPHAPNLIERIAGATTDIQYLIHQGFTEYEGTFWVGANALLRKSALEDIAQVEATSSLPIIKFIQDRTVIEDTESSIDLIARGWTLYNYPERLAYSATPPDFGALLIQRRRWANGGLLILPNCIRVLFQKPFGLSTLKEGFIRCHYLSSIAGENDRIHMERSSTCVCIKPSSAPCSSRRRHQVSSSSCH
jgi:cellulose synthase/poly-beta-1,6-N-acetylglucosamine synthase-like glycosyltransferase